MLKRKAESQLKEWRATRNNQALLVMGARQVGKTYLIEQFAKENYENVIKFDLVEQTDLLEAIKNITNVDELFIVLSAYAGSNMVPGKTVIFIDEVQQFKEAITLIKYLVQRNDFDYILSGSLLGVELNDLRSAPVGYVKLVEMFPLDFEEFCWANNIGQDAWGEVENAYLERRPVLEPVHERFLKLFHTYLIIGGMPRAVDEFVSTQNIATVNSIQNDILRLYKYDISKYVEQDKKLMIREIFDEIPSQLDSQTKRFNFSSLAPRGTYERYKDDFIWLIDAGVAIPVRNVKEPKKPLRLLEERSYFKLYMNDVGLLSAACGMDVVRELIGSDYSINYGSIYENAVAQELHAHGKGGYFFRNRKLGEIDFLVQKSSSVMPIEVKSGKTYKRHNALNNLLSTPNYSIDEAIVLCEKNLEVGINNKITYCPVYMAAFI